MGPTATVEVLYICIARQVESIYIQVYIHIAIDKFIQYVQVVYNNEDARRARGICSVELLFHTVLGIHTCSGRMNIAAAPMSNTLNICSTQDMLSGVYCSFL